RALPALALRAPLASQSAPGGLVFGYFLFDCKDSYLLLGNCSCVALLQTIHGLMQYLHSPHPCNLATQERLPRRSKRK
ncbi:hypothetical protein, partial [Candidatus Methylobacter oryzae]|uniref:hypothetical protein n=1 Tax=Candidatus Methylobacter oryzae TaxID=2497749 RepID=UPI0019D6911D